jgi:hypothetical protein
VEVYHSSYQAYDLLNGYDYYIWYALLNGKYQIRDFSCQAISKDKKNSFLIIEYYMLTHNKHGEPISGCSFPPNHPF